MTDIVSTATRSRMMAGIKSGHTQPEMLVRRLLHRQGFRFRLHVRTLPGKPDIVLPRYQAVIFVHGCFWHGHHCPLFRLPGTRQNFWRHKIDCNRAHDQKVIKVLMLAGWRVGVVWECAVRGAGKNADMVVAQHLSDWLQGKNTFLEESACQAAT